MSNALTPREIQQRIRSGESMQALVEDSGMPLEKVEVFAAPVLAEREHIAATALGNVVRKLGESSNHRTLHQVTQERLQQRGLDADDVVWDAWRIAERKWIVQGTWEAGATTHQADFKYDQMGRFSVAANEDARWLLGENETLRVARRAHQAIDDPDHEPTVDFTDEFALVDALGVQAEKPTIRPLAELIAEAASDPAFDDEPDVEHTGNLADLEAQVLAEDFDLSDDALPLTPPTQLDVFYDMFHTLNEDSVEIYPGLAQVTPIGRRPEVAKPVIEAPPVADAPAEESGEQPKKVALRVVETTVVEGELLMDPHSVEEPAAPAVEPTAPAEPERPRLARRTRRKPTISPQPLEQSALNEVTGPVPTSGAPTSQSAPVDEPEKTGAIPRRRSRKRASVPSWDEIMFGPPSPKPPKRTS